MIKPELRLVELCSGIGAQYVGLTMNNLFDVKSIATADLDKEVVVSYAAMHHGLTNELINNYKEYPSKEEMVRELTDKRLGYDFEKDKPYDWNKLAKRKDKTKGIEKYWLADKLSNNLGDMTQIKSLPESDFLSYSTPCTDLSIAGLQKGLEWTCQECGKKYDPLMFDINERYICPHCGSHNIKSTRSGLLYEVERLLVDAKDNNTLPKFLLMENVDALVSKKYIDSFNDWLVRLENLNYNNYYQCINSKFAGIPQNRNRIFVLSIRKDIDTNKFEFPQPFDSGLRLRDMLETDKEVLEKYFLSDEVQARLQITDPDFKKSIVGTTKPEFRTIGQRDLVYQKDSIMGALVATDYKQPKQIIECDETTNNPKRLFNIYGRDKGTSFAGNVYDKDYISPTVNTCQCGNRQPIVKEEKNNIKLVRKLSPKECHRLMGFSDDMYDCCKAVGMSDTQGYKQAGNSIVTNVIALIGEHLYKAQYDNTYKCYDENFQSPQES